MDRVVCFMAKLRRIMEKHVDNGRKRRRSNSMSQWHNYGKEDDQGEASIS
jgi:hypothetical protein